MLDDEAERENQKPYGGDGALAFDDSNDSE
jgi:hypothetical protein